MGHTGGRPGRECRAPHTRRTGHLGL